MWLFFCLLLHPVDVQWADWSFGSCWERRFCHYSDNRWSTLVYPSSSPHEIQRLQIILTLLSLTLKVMGIFTAVETTWTTSQRSLRVEWRTWLKNLGSCWGLFCFIGNLNQFKLLFILRDVMMDTCACVVLGGTWVRTLTSPNLWLEW